MNEPKLRGHLHLAITEPNNNKTPSCHFGSAIKYLNVSWCAASQTMKAIHKVSVNTTDTLIKKQGSVNDLKNYPKTLLLESKSRCQNCPVRRREKAGWSKTTLHHNMLFIWQEARRGTGSFTFRSGGSTHPKETHCGICGSFGFPKQHRHGGCFLLGAFLQLFLNKLVSLRYTWPVSKPCPLTLTSTSINPN